MLSMTGFGQATGESAAHRLAVTVRAVNHRYLDTVLRLPDLCRRSETSLQQLVATRLSRGRIELAVEVTRMTPRTPRLELRTEVAEAVVVAVAELRSAGLVEGNLAPGELLQVPGVVQIEAPEDEWTDGEESLLLEVTSSALDELLEARTGEGARLAQVLREKIDQVAGLCAELELLRPEVQRALADSLDRRLTELVEGGALDAGRLEQEVAVVLDRSNVSEELERLAAHVSHFGEILDQDGPVGKRLDFVVQEIFRELNTLGAKCRSMEMSRLAVEAKVLCEELREQLRNVE